MFLCGSKNIFKLILCSENIVAFVRICLNIKFSSIYYRLSIILDYNEQNLITFLNSHFQLFFVCLLKTC